VLLQDGFLPNDAVCNSDYGLDDRGILVQFSSGTEIKPAVDLPCSLLVVQGLKLSSNSSNLAFTFRSWRSQFEGISAHLHIICALRRLRSRLPAFQISGVIVVLVILVFKVWFVLGYSLFCFPRCLELDYSVFTCLDLALLGEPLARDRVAQLHPPPCTTHGAVVMLMQPASLHDCRHAMIELVRLIVSW
jgi:hypothetical protein